MNDNFFWGMVVGILTISFLSVVANIISPDPGPPPTKMTCLSGAIVIEAHDRNFYLPGDNWTKDTLEGCDKEPK